MSNFAQKTKFFNTFPKLFLLMVKIYLLYNLASKNLHINIILKSLNIIESNKIINKFLYPFCEARDKYINLRKYELG